MEPGVKRFSFRHIKSRIESYITERIHPDWPWWPKEAVNICSQLINLEDIVLEFGSGRSTIWLGKRCGSLTSVEHNHDWYMSVKKQISDCGLKNINLIFSPIDENTVTNNVPYLETLVKMHVDSFDLIIVDGKKRAFTTLHSLPRLKHGGVLIIDDAHRYLPERSNGRFPDSVDKEIWESVFHFIKDWRSIRASDGIHATDFYFKH